MPLSLQLYAYELVKNDMVDLEKLTLAELGQKAAHTYKNKTAFEIFRDGSVYNRITYREFGIRIRQLGALLVSLGIKPGHRVMILAENRPEWSIGYFSIALAGAVSVPVLTDFSAEQITAIAVHAGISALFITEKTKVKIANSGLDPALACIYIDSFPEFGAEPAGMLVSLYGREKRLPLFRHEEYPFPETHEQDLASIIYTSGTTGMSKGVMLSHRNLLFTTRAARSLMKIFSRDRLLSVIPLAHTYECTLGLLSAVMNGASTTYLDRAPASGVLFPAIQTLRPTIMVTVPLFIEKIYRQHIEPALNANPLYQFPLTRFLALYVAGRSLMRLFGASIRFFGIGGAPLAEDTETFLRKVQFPYAPGYGLTEMSPLVAGTGPYQFPFRSSGSMLKGVEVRIMPLQDETHVSAHAPQRKIPSTTYAQGEIQVRGPNMMLGYYRDPDRTQNAFTPDGWLKTGDLGYLDTKGHLFVRGRVKTMILGPSGENIYPEEIESLLNTSNLVEDALVYPGEKGELVALIVLSEKAQTMIAALEDGLEGIVRDLKNKVNKQLASFSRINRIEIQHEPFEKTPTQKIKRFLYPRK